MYDVPTGLVNRALFLDRLTLALSCSSRRRDQGCGVPLPDLDRFTEIKPCTGLRRGRRNLRDWGTGHLRGELEQGRSV
jgi:GGDEF domain-containing protein